MKKKLMIFVTLFIFMFGINNVSAMTLKPSGASSGKRGDEITLYITLERSSTEKTVSAVDGTVSYDADVLKLVSSSNLMEGWTEFAGISNGNTFGYGNITFDKLITTTSQNIVKMTFKINGSANYGNTTVSVSNPSATDEVGDSVSVSGGSHNVKVLSDVNTLSNLTISNGNINFNENTIGYNVTVENNVSSIKVEASLTDNKASFVSGYEPRTVNLNVGNNSIEIKVRAENEEVKTYTINVTRKDVDKPVNNNPTNNDPVKEETKKSNNTNLSELKLSEGTLVFDKEKTEYRVTVSYDIEKMEVTAKTEDEKAKFEITGNEELKVGENTITIKVTAEDNSEKEYKIIVIRKEENANLSSNSKLRSLTIKDYNINFSSSIYDYTIKIGNEDRLNITYTTADSKSDVTITGNENLENGSIIKVTVVAEDGTTTTYKINVEKDNAKNIVIISVMAFLLVALVVLSVILIKSRKKQTF